MAYPSCRVTMGSGWLLLHLERVERGKGSCVRYSPCCVVVSSMWFGVTSCYSCFRRILVLLEVWSVAVFRSWHLLAGATLG